MFLKLRLRYMLFSIYLSLIWNKYKFLAWIYLSTFFRNMSHLAKPAQKSYSERLIELIGKPGITAAITAAYSIYARGLYATSELMPGVYANGALTAAAIGYGASFSAGLAHQTILPYLEHDKKALQIERYVGQPAWVALVGSLLYMHFNQETIVVHSILQHSLHFGLSEAAAQWIFCMLTEKNAM
jgi:hypothetical protein